MNAPTSTPGYEWACASCTHSNGPGMSQCAACGFSARYTVRELDEVKGAKEIAPVPLSVTLGMFALLALAFGVSIFGPPWMAPVLAFVVLVTIYMILSWAAEFVLKVFVQVFRS